MNQLDRLIFAEQIDGSWLNNIAHKLPDFYHEITVRYDQYPYRIIFSRSGLDNEQANRWNQTAFAKCHERLGVRGPRWCDNRALCYYFKSKEDAFWFKMNCAFDVLQF